MIDDHMIYMESLKSYLANLNTIGKINLFTKIIDFKKANPKTDILFLDLNLENKIGLDFIDQTKKYKVLVHSSIKDLDVVKSCYKLGARGYLPKSSDIKEVILAIETLQNNQIFYSKLLTNIETYHLNGPLSKLTPKEYEYFKYMIKGLDNKEISEQMFISINTSRVHQFKILKKLACSDKSELLQRYSGYYIESD